MNVEVIIIFNWYDDMTFGGTWPYADANPLPNATKNPQFDFNMFNNTTCHISQWITFCSLYFIKEIAKSTLILIISLFIGSEKKKTNKSTTL